MDIQTLDRISNLSALSFTDEEKVKFIEDMGDIIALMDTVKDFELTYDDTKDNNAICFDDVREDKSAPSFSRDKLLQNTQPEDDCYVVPKMVE